MKTLTFNKLIKYSLLTVTLITAFLAALFIFENKPRIASASENAIASGEFIQENVGCYNNNGLTFSAALTIQKSSELHNTINSGRISTSNGYKEHYVVTVITDNIQSYNDVTNYKADKTTNVSYQNYNKINVDDVYNLLFTSNGATAERFILATPTSDSLSNANTFNATINHDFDGLSTGYVNFDIDKSLNNKYVYSFIIEYEYSATSLGGVMGGTQHYEKINVISKTENYIEFSSQNLVENRIKNVTYKNTELLKACQTYLGIYNDGYATVSVNYIKMKDYSQYENANVTFNIESVYATSPRIIEEELYNVLTNFNDITDFNAKYVDYEYVSNGAQNLLSEKIIREATSLEIIPDFTQTKTATVNVIYNDFNYSNLALYVSNNGFNTDTELLEMAVYTTDVNFDSGINKYTLTFNFSSIQQQLYNTCSWIFTLGADNFNISGRNEKINVTVNENALIVSFYKEDEKQLFGLSLKALAEIVADFDITYRYYYAKLDANLNESTLISTPKTVKYSNFVNLCSATNFYNEYGYIIDEAISNGVFAGGSYYKFNDVNVSIDKKNKTATVNVIYDYTTLLKLVGSNGAIKYIPLSKNNLNYEFSEFGFTAPEGYRIAKITREKSGVNVIYNDSNPYKSKITFNVAANLKKILTLNVEFTDTWILAVNHLVRYKDTPFAEYVTTKREIRVADYERSVYEFTASDVANIIGVKSLNVLISAPELIKVSFDNVSTYTIDVTYSYATLQQNDYDGNHVEIKIPLTSYSDWLNFYGKDWSIMFLNGGTAATQYFTYTNEIEANKLYGYFSVAVFNEQAKDFNYYFKYNTGDGCMTFYKSSEVKGSDLYKFFGTNQNSVLGGMAHVGMALCEVFNDNNAIYQSYFFYLDCTSNQAWISNGGGSGANDFDSAFGNVTNAFGTQLNEFFNKFGADFSNWWNNSVAPVFQVIIWVLIGIGGLALLLWLLSLIKFK